MAENLIERGEVFFIHLDPVFGRELGGYKERPVVVVSINDIHRNTRLITIVPGTTTAIDRPNIVGVTPDAGNRLREPTYFQCHQIRAVDQGRMTRRAAGRLSRVDVQRIESAIRTTLGLP